MRRTVLTLGVAAAVVGCGTTASTSTSTTPPPPVSAAQHKRDEAVFIRRCLKYFSVDGKVLPDAARDCACQLREQIEGDTEFLPPGGLHGLVTGAANADGIRGVSDWLTEYAASDPACLH
jgi:hypothetical protein